MAKAITFAEIPSYVKELVKAEEGVFYVVSPDGKGFTGGRGHKLSKSELKKYPVGSKISEELMEEWFEKDLTKSYNAAVEQNKKIPKNVPIDRLTSVNFQLGNQWYKDFDETWKLMQDGKFLEASVEALDSKWYKKQTPTRAQKFSTALALLLNPPIPESKVAYEERNRIPDPRSSDVLEDIEVPPPMSGVIGEGIRIPKPRSEEIKNIVAEVTQRQEARRNLEGTELPIPKNLIANESRLNIDTIDFADSNNNERVPDDTSIPLDGSSSLRDNIELLGYEKESNYVSPNVVPAPRSGEIGQDVVVPPSRSAEIGEDVVVPPTRSDKILADREIPETRSEEIKNKIAEAVARQQAERNLKGTELPIPENIIADEPRLSADTIDFRNVENIGLPTDVDSERPTSALRENIELLGYEEEGPQTSITETSPSALVDLQLPSFEDYIEDEPVQPFFTLEDASAARKVQFGAAREQTILGNLYDMAKAKIRYLSTDDKSYTEVLRDITKEELEEVYKEFPEFRGIGVYDEDLTMMGGRMGVAFVDPVTFLVPWAKAYKVGKIGTMAAGAAFGAGDAALYGHVHHGEIDGLTVGLSATIGGTAMLASRQLAQRWKNRTTRAASERGQSVANAADESVKDSKKILKTLEEAENIPDGPTVSTTPARKNDTRPMREILKDWRRGFDPITVLPANASHSDIVRAHRKFQLTGQQYRIEEEVLNYINNTAEDIINTTGRKYRPDPAVAYKLTQELSDMVSINNEIKTIKKEIDKLRVQGGRTNNKKIKALSQKLTEPGGLDEQMAQASAKNFKSTVSRAMDGNNLSLEIFDRAVKEDKLTPTMTQALIRETTRPVFGSVGGLTASYFFADEDDGAGFHLSWMVAGAALGQWQKRLQRANISALNLETGMMEVATGWRRMLSAGNLKYLTGASAATKLDSLGGVGKVLSNLLFDRPGGPTNSLETRVAEKSREFYQQLGTSLDTAYTNTADSIMLREIIGEVLNGYVSLNYRRPKDIDYVRVGYRGLNNKYDKGLTQEQVNLITNVAPKLIRQREELAKSVKAVGIDFDKIDNYGMPQLYNFKAIRQNQELFKDILRKQFITVDRFGTKVAPYGEGSQLDEHVDHLFKKMFNKDFNQKTANRNFDPLSMVDNKFRVRPLLDHFEKERVITNFDVRKELAENGFIELDVAKTFSTYGHKTIKIREFAETFGPNGEFITEAFDIVDRSFKGKFNTEEYKSYKNYMRGSVNAFFGKHGKQYSSFIPGTSVAIQSFVALSNMMFLTRTGVSTALADFIAPFKTTSIKAAAQGIGGRFGKGEPLHKRAGLQYDNAWELEFSALMAHSDDPLSAVSSKMNEWQRKFFEWTQLKRVTEATGKYAFDVGAYRAFDIAKKLSQNPQARTPALEREIQELGIEAFDNSIAYLSKFRNAKEAFDDDFGKEILSRAGQKAMDRDRLVPKVGNRLLFTQHRDPVIRSLGQFLSWSQAKTAQTNALVKRIEAGDMKLAMRILGGVVIGNGAVQLWRDILKPTYDPEKDLDTEQFALKTLELSGDFLPWWAVKAGAANKYTLKRDDYDFESVLKSLSPSITYGFSVGSAPFSAYDNIVDEEDYEGAGADIINVLPIASEINRQLKRFDLGLENTPKNTRTWTPPISMSKGGEVNVPQAPIEPDERIDKMTGMPYHLQAGTAFIDEEDPLKRLGFGIGGLGSLDTLLDAIPTPIKAGITSLFHQGTWDEDFLNKEERARLKEVVAERIKANSSSISYRDIDPQKKGSGIGYGMELPSFSDVNKTLKFTIGKADIVRDGNNVMVADEFDFPLSSETKKLEGFVDKANFLANKAVEAVTEYGKENPSVSFYGLAHYIGEVAGPQEGEGPSVRFNMGSPEDLNISPQQFRRLPTLDAYKAQNQHRIRPEELSSERSGQGLGGVQVDHLARLGFSGGSSVVDAITRHHIKNLKGKTYATNNRGQIQTVYTRQVNDPRLNDGMPTLIPSVYNKKVLSERDAIEEAVNSKIDWPSANTHPELRKKDIEIHRPFNQDLVDYGIIPKRTGKVLGSVVRTLAKQTAKQGKSKGGKVLGALSRATVNA